MGTTTFGRRRVIGDNSFRRLSAVASAPSSSPVFGRLALSRSARRMKKKDRPIRWVISLRT